MSVVDEKSANTSEPVIIRSQLEYMRGPVHDEMTRWSDITSKKLFSILLRGLSAWKPNKRFPIVCTILDCEIGLTLSPQEEQGADQDRMSLALRVCRIILEQKSA